MYTLAYESIATEQMKFRDMELLLAHARTKNNRSGITGCLVYYEGGFLQLLEGERAAVEKVYEKIKLDNRHKDLHLFSDDTITERTFPNWGMAYYPVSEDHSSQYEFEQFKRNLLLLTDLIEPTNVTAKLFWKRIKILLAHPPSKF